MSFLTTLDTSITVIFFRRASISTLLPRSTQPEGDSNCVRTRRCLCCLENGGLGTHECVRHRFRRDLIPPGVYMYVDSWRTFHKLIFEFFWFGCWRCCSPPPRLSSLPSMGEFQLSTCLWSWGNKPGKSINPREILRKVSSSLTSAPQNSRYDYETFHDCAVRWNPHKLGERIWMSFHQGAVLFYSDEIGVSYCLNRVAFFFQFYRIFCILLTEGLRAHIFKARLPNHADDFVPVEVIIIGTKDATSYMQVTSRTAGDVHHRTSLPIISSWAWIIQHKARSWNSFLADRMKC